jgi:Flp pilus assembly protein TadG
MLGFASICRDERGNSLIEMGLAAPLLAALLIGMVDISRAVSAKVNVEQAAQRTIEKVQAQATFKTSDEPTLQSDAEAAAGAGSTATVTAWLECNHDGVKLDYDTGSCSTGSTFARYVELNVQNTFTPLFGTGLFPGANADGTVDVNGNATLRVQ